MADDLTLAQRHAAETGADISRIAKRTCAAVCTGYAYDAISDDFSRFRTQLDALKDVPGGRAAILQVARGLL